MSDEINRKLDNLGISLIDVDRKVDLIQQKTELELQRGNDLFEEHLKDDNETGGKFLDLLQRISDQSVQTQECFTKLDKKLDLQIQKSEYELKHIKDTNTTQNNLLDEHMRRTEIAEIRISELEIPSKSMEHIKRIVMWFSAIGGGLVILAKLMKLF